MKKLSEQLRYFCGFYSDYHANHFADLAESLEADSQLLKHLQESGVDNWEGYSRPNSEDDDNER